MSNVAAKRLVKVPKYVKWSQSRNIIKMGRIIDGVDHPIEVVHHYFNDNKHEISYLRFTGKQEDFEIIAATVGVFDLEAVSEDTDQTKVEIMLFDIDAFGSGWKSGMVIANAYLSKVSESKGYLFLGECNLIEAKKASLIGNAKKEITVESRHRRLTEMMNELGYWNDSKMFDEWLATLESEESNVPSIIIEKTGEDVNVLVRKDHIREIMLGKGYVKPW